MEDNWQLLKLTWKNRHPYLGRTGGSSKFNWPGLPVASFYLTHPFWTARSASWQTAHARVGGVQPLNLEASRRWLYLDIQLRTAVFEAARRMPERVEAFTR